MTTRWKKARAVLTAVVATAMIFATPEAWPLSAVGAEGAAADQPKALFINILEGEGALNDVRTRTAREPIVEVDDENHKPVAGALVLFAMDSGGGSPYASFAGSETVSVQTDAAGRAVARGFQITQRKGRYSIKVRATQGGVVAEATIAMSNIVVLLSDSGSENPIPVVSHHKAVWVIGSVVAVGIVAGVVIASRGTATTITPGTGTVGAPGAVSGIHIQLGRRR